MRKLIIVIVCLVMMFGIVSSSLAADTGEKTEVSKIVLIIDDNCIYIPAKIKVAYKDTLSFTLKDGTKVELTNYQMITTSLARCAQICEELKTKNFIVFE